MNKKETSPAPVSAVSTDWMNVGMTALVIFIFAVNFFFPRQYGAASIGALSFLPFPWQALWFVAGLLAIAHAPLLERARRGMLAGVAIAFVITLVLFRSEYPSVHGDGENGGKPWTTEQISLGKLFVDTNSRLGPVINRAFSKVNPIDLHPRTPRVTRDRRLDSSDLILSTIWGTLFAICVFWGTRSFGLPLAILLLTYPAALNFYGHYDDYSLPAMLAMAWLLALFSPRQGGKRIAILLVLGAIATSAHPLLVILVPLTLVYEIMRWMESKNWTWYRRYVVIAPLAAGLLLMLTRRGLLQNLQVCKPGSEVMPYFFLERTNLLLLTTLPAWLLLIGGMRDRVADAARYYGGLFTVSLSTILYFSLFLTLGIYDEFLMSVVGVMLLAGALLVYFARETSSHRLLAYVAVVSLFLFVPRVCVNSSQRVLDWFLRYGEAEPYSPLHVGSTPYIHAAIRTPVTSSDDLRLRAEILRKGILTQHRYWKERQGWNVAFYLVWEVEANGMTDPTKKLLTQVIESDPQQALGLCDSRAYEREHYPGRSAKIIRDASLEILQARIQSGRASEIDRKVYEMLRMQKM